jgi:hypothetical protein
VLTVICFPKVKNIVSKRFPWTLCSIPITLLLNILYSFGYDLKLVLFFSVEMMNYCQAVRRLKG